MKAMGNKVLAAGSTGDTKEEKLLKADLHQERAEAIEASKDERKYEERLRRQDKEREMTQQKLETSKQVANKPLANPDFVDSSKITTTTTANQLNDPILIGSNVPQSTTTRTVHSTVTKTEGGF